MALDQETFSSVNVFPSTNSRRAAKVWTLSILVNRLETLSLSRNSVVKLTDRPDMTVYVDVYCGGKTAKHNNNNDKS